MKNRKKILFYAVIIIIFVIVLISGWNLKAHFVGGFEQEPAEVTLPVELLPEVDCDYLIKSGYIVDGTGNKGYTGDIAVKGDKIVALGLLEAAPQAEIIDASGMVVAPGFIDIHTHTEQYLKQGADAGMILLQGVTTHIGGNCGSSVDDIDEFFSSFEKTGVNLGLYAGYKNLRLKVLGNQKAPPTENQLEQMKAVLEEYMRDGAFGLSVGLGYWPQYYATTEELVDLCRVVKKYGGIYACHIRDEGDNVIDALGEAITIGLKAGIPVEYSHIKIARERNWGKMSHVLQLMEEARENGLDITADVYGYTFSSLDVGKGRNSINEGDLVMALTHPLVMIGSDSGLSKNGRAVHPRAYGNYPRILRKYVREKGLLTLEEAVHKMTAMPAKKLRLRDRGLLAEGYKADIVIFDFDEITDRSDRENPNLLPVGVKEVFVNGVLSVHKGELTGELGGQALKLCP